MSTLISPGDIILNSWMNFRKNIKIYSKLIALLTILSIVQWTLWTITLLTVPEKILRSVIYGVLSLPTSFLFALLAIATIDIVACSLQKKTPALLTSISVAFHKFFSVIWVSILVSLAIGAGLILLIIPGIIFFIWFHFAHVYTIVDDVRGTGALTASKKLVSGRWWKVLFRLLFPAIFFTICSTFFSALIFLILGAIVGDPGLYFSQITTLNQIPTTISFIQTIIPEIIKAAILPILVCANLILWFDLKRTIE